MISFRKILILHIINHRIIPLLYTDPPSHCSPSLPLNPTLLFKIVIWYTFFLFQCNNLKVRGTSNTPELLLISLIVVLILWYFLLVVFDNITNRLKVGLHLFMMISALIGLASTDELRHQFEHLPWASFLFHLELGLKVLEED
jgi:hypothetical protein